MVKDQVHPPRCYCVHGHETACSGMAFSAVSRRFQAHIGFAPAASPEMPSAQSNPAHR